MNEQIKQIAARVRGLRDVLELSEEDVAETCQMSLDEYRKVESGTVDISVISLPVPVQVCRWSAGLPINTNLWPQAFWDVSPTRLS